MFLYAKVTYGFRLPQEYDEMKKFEADNDMSKFRKTEDTIATRYTQTVEACYPYRSKERANEGGD